MTSKKDTILDTSTSLFCKHGYHSVGIDRITSESNIAKMTLYKYFPSKENLIENILLRRDQQLRESILSAVEKQAIGTKKLKAIFDWYEKWMRNQDFHGCMFIKAANEFPDANLKIRSISKEHKLWLRSLLQSILTDMSAESPSQLASYIMVILDGLTVSANILGEEGKHQIKMAWKYVTTMLPSD